MKMTSEDFKPINLNILICEVDGGFYEGGYDVIYQRYMPFDKVSYSGKLKHDVVFIVGKNKMEPTKCNSLDDAIAIANKALENNNED